MSSPKLFLQKKMKHFKVLVLGQAGVGKTALTVRYITRRFIGEYDPTLERKYCMQTEIDDDFVSLDILDTAAQDPQADSLYLEEHIRWADAYLLVFSVTDRCSLDHLTHLRFHISHRASKKPWKSSIIKDHIPVLLIGNKNDLIGQRMIHPTEARKRAEELHCSGYHDISVRESYEDSKDVFTDLYKIWKSTTQSHRKVLKRQEELHVSPPSPRRRNHRSSLFRYSHSSSTDSDTASTVVASVNNNYHHLSNNKPPNGSSGSCSSGNAFTSSDIHSSDKGHHHDVPKEPLKRKPSVHKRLMMRVMPSFRVSRETDEGNDPT